MATYIRQGMPNEPKNTWSENAVQTISFDFVADGAGVFASQSIADIGGRLAGAAVIFGATVPDALGVTIDDTDGIDLLSGAGASITATKRITNSPPQVFSSGLTVTPTGNTTAGAIITVKLYFI